MTCDTCNLAMHLDLVQGITVLSQGEVLSPRNEGYMAVIVYVTILPHISSYCVHMSISGLSSLVQFLYMPATVGRPVC